MVWIWLEVGAGGGVPVELDIHAVGKYTEMEKCME